MVRHIAKIPGSFNKAFRAFTILFTALILVLQLSGCSVEKTPAYANGSGCADVVFFDAGDADAILLTHEGFSVLVDTGLKGYGATILDYLASEGITHLDYLIITHFDQDHVGGAAEIINSIQVDHVLQGLPLKNNDEYARYLRALSVTGIDTETVDKITNYNLNGVLMTVYPPEVKPDTEISSNDSSLIVAFSYEKHSVLLTGDAENERLDDFIKVSDAHYDLVKMPHHGRYHGSAKDLIKHVTPEYAVICCENGNDVSDKTLDMLYRRAIKTYFTADGPVTARIDTSGVSLSQR